MKRKILNTALIGIIVLKIFINICRLIEWSLKYYYDIGAITSAFHNESDEDRSLCWYALDMIFDTINKDIIIDTIFLIIVLIISIIIIFGKSHKSDK